MTSLYIPDFSEMLAVSHSRGADSEAPDLWKGLVGLLPIGAGGGPTAYELSGFGKHGTLTNMDPATDWVATEKGYALDFDGNNDEVVLPQVGNVCSGIATFSALLWVRTSNLTVDQRAWAVERSGNLIFLIWMDTGGVDGWAAAVYDSTPAIHKIGEAVASAVANQWQCVLVTCRQSEANGFKLYVDGVLRDQVNAPADLSAAYLSHHLGRYVADYGLIQVSNAMLWDRALALDEIQQLYVDPHALLTLRRKVYASTVAVGVAPTSHLYGSLVGPLGGAV